MFLATDTESGNKVVLKTPSMDLRHEPAYLEAFLMEEWVARRIDNIHILKAAPQSRERKSLYTVMEFVDGQSLAQWMVDHPKPSLEAVRQIVEQIAKGLRAFHRMDMLHQDIRPENILINQDGTVKLIDFGSTQVAGLMELSSNIDRSSVPGAIQYAAPEYFLGEIGSEESDLFSLAVLTYQMLSGRLPYGTDVPRITTKAGQNRLSYRSVLDEERDIPTWVDFTLKRALHPDRFKRHEDLFEFVHELRQPSQRFLNQSRPPLIERDPVRFWQCVSLALAMALLYMIYDKLG